jgi:7-cyano-7-deazaguanine reductase
MVDFGGPAVKPPGLTVQGDEAIEAGVLETFTYEYAGRETVVEIVTDEFTAVCPWSGLPDFGTVTIRYLPQAKILELRSLKYYLLSFRSVGIYQEHAVNRITDDLVRAVEPKWMDVTLDYKIRGGIHTLCRVRWPQ